MPYIIDRKGNKMTTKEIEIIATPDMICHDHIYREEREFKKQKKEKFKSPMWNF